MTKCGHKWAYNKDGKPPFGAWFKCELCGEKVKPDYLNTLEERLCVVEKERDEWKAAFERRVKNSVVIFRDSQFERD